MKRGILKEKKAFCLALVILILFFGMGTMFLEAGICESALDKCFDDPYNQAWNYIGAMYCLLGYGFCLKYIKPD